MNERITYIVKEGENLYSIAKKYNTTVQQLIDLNKLHNTVLSVGQNIVISEKDIKEEKNSFDYQQFLKQNLGTGTLKVQTLIGTTYFPIPSVKIEIYKDFNGKSELFFSGYTGDSVYIDGIVLPCQII